MKFYFVRRKSGISAIVLMALVFACIFVLNSFTSHAEDNNKQKYLETTDAVYQVNPLYAGIISENDLYHGSEVQVTEADILNAENVCSNIDEIVALIRPALKRRDKNIIIYFSFAGTNYDGTSLIAIENNAFNLAMNHTGVGDEGDYLKWGYSGMGMQIAYDKQSGNTKGSFIYYMTYYTTPEQEQSVTAKVSQISGNLGLSSKSEYDKVLSVYEYLCNNVKYDYGNDLIKYTCYGAAINNSAVCQGFALLAYRLLNDAGVNCRMIAGNTSIGAHGWNIVKVGTAYYNLDATWDAGKTKEQYTYFMKSDSDFEDHTRWDQYKTNEFMAAFPMSTESYNTGVVGSFVAVKSLKMLKDKLTLKAGESSKLSADVKPLKAASKLTWKTNEKSIATVDASGNVTGVGAGTCTITVSSADGKMKDVCYVTVSAKDESVKSLKLNKKKLKLKKGKKFQLVVTIKPEAAANTSLIFTCSNKKVAKINKKGVIRGVGKGKCTITVTTKDGKKKATCKVTVKE